MNGRDVNQDGAFDADSLGSCKDEAKTNSLGGLKDGVHEGSKADGDTSKLDSTETLEPRMSSAYITQDDELEKDDDECETETKLVNASVGKFTIWKAIKKPKMFEIVEGRTKILRFRQYEDESLGEAWERYKELIRKCPYHGLPYAIQMEHFYGGLEEASMMMLDATAHGSLLSKTYNEAYKILETISQNHNEWSKPKRNPAKEGQLELDALSAIQAQLTTMATTLKNPQKGNAFNVQNASPISQSSMESCIYYGEDHTSEYCPSNPADVMYIGSAHNQMHSNNPYLNTYSPRWRQHPNFSWGGQENAPSVPQRQQRLNQSPEFMNQNTRGYPHNQNALNYNHPHNQNFQNPMSPQHVPGTSLESFFKEY